MVSFMRITFELLVVTLSQYDAVIGIRTAGITESDFTAVRYDSRCVSMGSLVDVMRLAGSAQLYVAQHSIPMPRKRYSVHVVPIPWRTTSLPLYWSLLAFVDQLEGDGEGGEGAAPKKKRRKNSKTVL